VPVRLQPFDGGGRQAVSLEERPRLWLRTTSDRAGPHHHWREATGQEWRELEAGARLEALAYLSETPGPLGDWAKVQTGLAALGLIVRLIERPELVGEATTRMRESIRFLLGEPKEG
jgi:hypothetical protein